LQRDEGARASLDERDRALLDFARKLNDAPDAVSFEDINRLRVAGFTDQNIFDTVMVVAYFNFINRVADGLGVPLEPETQQSYERHRDDVMAA